jgi:sigma-E factor negative regulatory protein RseB
VRAKATGLCLVGVIAAIGASTASASKNADSDSKSTHKPNPGRLLTEASKAIQNSSYRGQLISSRSGQINTMRVFHRRKHGREQQRLVAVNGPEREIILKGSKQISILPSKKLVLISRQRHEGVMKPITRMAVSRMQESYTLQEDGTDRVAGRKARILEIKPDDRYRYGYRLSLDEKKQLPLKLELIDRGRVLERLMFGDIRFEKSIADRHFEPKYDIDGFRVVKHRSIEKKPTQKSSVHWKAGKLPPGFKRVESGVRRVSKKASVRQILYSDGLASVSAFIAPKGLRPSLKGGSSLGPVNAFGREVDNDQITVVGEVPAATVKMIGKHLEREHGD